MTSLLGRGVGWLRGLSDLTHHGIVGGVSALTVPLIHSLPQHYMAAITCTAVATQLGAHAWVANVAGPTMFLNMERKNFGDIQARLFPKLGMWSVGSGVVALTAYMAAHPHSDTLTHALTLSLCTHLAQSYLVFPITTKYQYRLREYEEGSAERKSAGMRFGMFHALSMSLALLTTGISVYFFYAVGNRIAHTW